VRGSDLDEVIVDGGESAKDLNRPGVQRLLALVNSGKVDAVIVAKLDRLTRSVKDLCALLELFEKRKVALISVVESLDTGSAAGRLVITIMGAVSQWEREAIGERTRDALRHKRTSGERVGGSSNKARPANRTNIAGGGTSRGVLSQQAGFGVKARPEIRKLSPSLMEKRAQHICLICSHDRLQPLSLQPKAKLHSCAIPARRSPHVNHQDNSCRLLRRCVHGHGDKRGTSLFLPPAK